MNKIIRSSSASESGIKKNSSLKQGAFWQKRFSFWLLLGIAAFYLITEHGAHLVENLAWLPFLFILACPLIHMFGHGHHGGSGSHAHQQAPDVEQSVEGRKHTDATAEQPTDHTSIRGDHSK